MSTTTTDPTLRQRLPLYPNYLLAAMPVASLCPLLDSMMSDLGVPLGRGGLISGGVFAGAVLGLVLLNLTLSRVPAKRALCGGTAGLGLGLIAGGWLAQNLWGLFLAYLVVGLAGAISTTASWMWITAHIRENMAASALAMIVFFGLGMIAIPVAVGLAIDMGATWRVVLLVEGGIALLSAVAFAFMPLLDIPERQDTRLPHIKATFKYDRVLLAAMLGAGFTYTGAEAAFNVWLPKFQIDTFQSTDAWASLSVTLFWVGLVAGRLGFMPLTRRFSAARLIVVCAGVMAAFSVALAFAPSQATALVMAIGTGLGASATYGLISSYSQRFPGPLSGVALSLFMLSGSLGGLVLPYVFGPLAHAAGFRVAVALIAVPAIACCLFAELIHKRAENGL